MHPLIQHAPDPDHPGWWTWDLSGPDRYNASIGKLLVRGEGPGQARCRIVPDLYQSNLGGVVHGGAILTFIDMALFAGGRLAGLSDITHAVTLDLTCQFIDVGRLGEPLDCVVELIVRPGGSPFCAGSSSRTGAPLPPGAARCARAGSGGEGRPRGALPGDGIGR
jgi:acyl-coenzyme A thioesterase PaaI-like protein